MSKRKFKEGMIFKVTANGSEKNNLIKIVGFDECNRRVRYKTIIDQAGYGKSFSTFRIGSIFEMSLEPVEGNETIVVYRKDREVIALDKRTDKKAVAKCNPSDEFDFETGAKLAFERLFPKEGTPYNGKICITEVTEGIHLGMGEPAFKVGNIIEIADGKFDLFGDKFPMNYKLECVEDIKEYLEHIPGKHDCHFSNDVYKFVEVVD